MWIHLLISCNNIKENEIQIYITVTSLFGYSNSFRCKRHFDSFLMKVSFHYFYTLFTLTQKKRDNNVNLGYFLSMSSTQRKNYG